jgi:hypothetical protein
LPRAKRTDRADARRRYRAQLAAEVEDGDEEAPAAPAAEPRPGTPRPAAPPARPGIGYAFRAAFHPLDIRGDLAYLPALIRTRSVWLPALLTVVTTVLYLTTIRSATGESAIGIVATLMFQYFVYPPPVGGAFLAGFRAPRASWLAGLVVSVVSLVCLAILLASVPSPAVLNNPALTVETTTSILLQAVPISIPMSVLFASAAAWYKRFLHLANPNRGRRPAGKPTRDAARRGRDQRPATRSR